MTWTGRPDAILAPGSGPSRRGPRLVLNVGSGPHGPRSLHPGFHEDGWAEIRVDIDPASDPDVIGSFADLRPHFAEASFDAVWSSHSLEHLFRHEVHQALAEFHRVLKPTGFALITCPDLDAVADLLLRFGLDHVAYESPAGPITVHDILFGYLPSVAAGQVHMAHRTGFTRERLGRDALGAGFAAAHVGRGSAMDLWAVLLREAADLRSIEATLAYTDAAFLVSPTEIGLQWFR